VRLWRRVEAWFLARGYTIHLKWLRPGDKGYAEEAIDDFLSGKDESGQPRDRRGPG
jgi:hypothetical protein